MNLILISYLFLIFILNCPVVSLNSNAFPFVFTSELRLKQCVIHVIIDYFWCFFLCVLSEQNQRTGIRIILYQSGEPWSGSRTRPWILRVPQHSALVLAAVAVAAAAAVAASTQASVCSTPLDWTHSAGFPLSSPLWTGQRSNILMFTWGYTGNITLDHGNGNIIYTVIKNYVPKFSN